jgi:GNAT superfamily N-acetyltransferase
MDATIRDVAESTLDDIPDVCSSCIYWSFPGEFERMQSELSNRKEELRAKKRSWAVQMLREFGSCGKILYHNNMPLGYTEYGPSRYFPNIKMYKSQPIGSIEEGIVFLACLYIANADLRRKGLGEQLLEATIADLKRRGFKAVETYARRGSPQNPSGPAELYLKKGFHMKDATNPEFPIMKLDLRSG